MDWKNDIPGCFGSVDQVFAGHPSDEEHAKELRKNLIASEISFRDLEDAIVGHMFRKGCNLDHMNEQMKTVTRLFKAKLAA